MAISTMKDKQRKIKEMRDMLNDPHKDPYGVKDRHLNMQAVHQTTTPSAPLSDNPVEGNLAGTLRELGGFMSDSMVTELLVSAANSDFTKDRALVAMHKLTPISTVTTLLGDKDASVRYFAERRLAAEEYPDGTD